jgi:hypothetical protein
MGRTDELEKIDRIIKDTETRIKTLLSNMEALDSEIKKIAVLEDVLIENVKILRTTQVVAVAQEFRRAKDELKRTKLRLVGLRNDREYYNKASKDAREFLKTAQTEYKKIAKEGENNVLSFRRSDGKK